MTSPDSTPRRKDRWVRDDVWIVSMLSSSLFCTVGTAANGWAYQRPSAFFFDAEKRAIYIHGAHSGRAISNAVENDKVTICVYDIGAMRLHARAFEFLQEHAGVVVFGRARLEEDNREKHRVMQATFAKHAPHLQCNVDYEPASQMEIDETTVIRIEIENWSGKMKWTDDPTRPRFTYDSVPIARPALPWHPDNADAEPVTVEWAESLRASEYSRFKDPSYQPIGAPIAIDLPRPFPSGHDLCGQRCTLTRLNPIRHAEGLFEAFGEDNEDRNWTYLPYGPFNDHDEFRIWLNSLSSERDPMFYTVLDQRGAPVGMTSFLRIDPQMATIEVGHIHFSLKVQRTPVATEAMYLMMRNVFETLGYRRCEWKCDALNRPSRLAASRLGFKFEGVFRKAAHYKGRNRDTAWFAIVDSDWSAHERAFEAWLAAENFGQDGKQIKALRDMMVV